MTAPDLVVPVEVVVVDPDLLWRVEVMNALPGLMVKDVVTVFGAMEHLTSDSPAVLVLGPAGVSDSRGQLVELREAFPEVRVVAVEGDLETDLGTLTDIPRLSLVPEFTDADTDDGDGDGDGDADGPPVAHPVAGTPSGVTAAGEVVDRWLPAGTPLATLVQAVHEELAIVRGVSDDQPGGRYHSLADTQVLLITSAKGGDGATTVAANLAAALAAQGRAVGLVEGDPVFGDLAMMLALPVPSPGIATDPETGIRLVMPARPPGFETIEVDRLIDELSAADPPFDVVVIDAPVIIADRTGLASLADQVLVVCSSSLSSIKNAVILLEILERPEKVGVVVNRVGRRGGARQLEDVLKTRIAAELPFTDELALDRPDQEPALASRRSPFAKQLARLASEVSVGTRGPS